MRLVPLSLALLGGMTAAAQAAPVEWAVADGGNGHFYELVTTPLTFDQASAAAQASTFMGVSGHLVTITSAAEQAFLDTLNPTNIDAWIGASDTDHEGVFEWVTGPEAGQVFWTAADGTITYSNWNSGEPNNWGSSGEDFVEGWFGGQADWNDIAGTASNAYIVEYSISAIPLPAALPLLALGLGALGYAGRRQRQN